MEQELAVGVCSGATDASVVQSIDAAPQRPSLLCTPHVLAAWNPMVEYGDTLCIRREELQRLTRHQMLCREVCCRRNHTRRVRGSDDRCSPTSDATRLWTALSVAPTDANMTRLSRERLLVCRTTPLLHELGLPDGCQANVCCYHVPHPLLFFSTKTFCDFATSSCFRRKGREDPKPLSTAQTPPPSQNVPTPPYVNQHVRVC
jgi:hypothetical protein